MKKFIYKNIAVVALLLFSISNAFGYHNDTPPPTIIITGSTSSSVGTTNTYTAAPSVSGIVVFSATWSVVGGTIQSQNTTSATVSWTSSGLNVLTYNATTNFGSMTQNLAVNVTGAAAPSSPPNPTIASQNCSTATLQKSGSPASGITWYWQGTNTSGTSTANNATSNYTANSSGIYYIRARNSSGTWSTSSGSVTVAIGSGGVTWYADMDGDGLGDPGATLTQCSQPLGYVANNADACPSSHGNGSIDGCPQASAFSNRNYVHTITPQKAVDHISEITDVKDAIKNITYFDGLGRAEQSIGIAAGGVPLNNSMLPDDWTLGHSGSTAFYNVNGANSENTIINGTTPFGESDLLWECKPDTGNNADGGWNSDYFSIDKTKTYRYSVWVKRTGSQNGTTYHGIQNVNNLSGSSNGNPYFWAGDLPQLDTWYLLVGIVHPYNYTGGDTGVSGVYDVNGNRVINKTEFKWRSNTTSTRVRSYLYYCTDTTVRQYFWNPKFQEGGGTAEETITESKPSDIVTYMEYDALGRQVKEYLPYATDLADTEHGVFKTDALTKTNAYYVDNYRTDVNSSTPNPFSEKLFENSPLSRVLKQAAPGEDWKLNSGNEIKLDYQVNKENEVKRYQVTLSGSTPSLTLDTSYRNGYYTKGHLYKTVTRDENWKYNQTYYNDHSTEEFKDKLGRVILKRTYVNNVKHDTYYVYDVYGNLTYVLPPKMDAATNSLATVNSKLNDLGYQYKYDYKNRLIEKKIPGKGWESIVYDKLNRPVLTQDAVQKPSRKWLFTKYDQLGRVVYTGLYTHPSNINQTAMQIYFDGQNNTAGELYETKLTSGGPLGIYYSRNDFPTTSVEVLTVNYYDNYTFDRAGSGTSITSYGVASTSRLKGLATGSKVKVLGTSNWTTTVSYYDEKARPIRVYSKNDYLQTTDVVDSKLDFVGKVEEITTLHTKIGNGLPTITTVDAFTYDHVGRLVSQTKEINNGSKEVITINEYDKLGQLKNKKVGGAAAAVAHSSKGLQVVDYAYNIRGWLKNINQDIHNDNDLFNFTLNYNDPTSGTALFNGNISQTSWNTLNIGDSSTKTYTYAYDALNRITSAVDNTSKYNLNNVSYDKNGNILNLQRQGHVVANPILGTNSHFGVMDDLTYTYDSGNKLKKVLDNGDDNYGFKDGHNYTTEYTYDVNGNMKTDANKNITNITYNHLNLPTQVTISSQNITYVYDASGVKQAKTVNGVTTQYAGNHIYENNTLQFFNHAEGYVQNNSGNFSYVYQYKDHLGNVRLSYADANNNGSIASSEIVEESNYYPFGLKHKGYNNVVSSNGNSVAQKYGYTGKEHQDELGLGWIDITARNYNPDLGKWMNIDPLAEQMPTYSPYAYSYNSPILYNDPNGKIPIAPILWWAGKRVAAGAIADMTVQLISEWVANGGSIQEAWNRLEIDGWQVARSAGENLIKGKYTSAALSAGGDMISYMMSNENWTWEGALASAGEGGASALLGDKLAKQFSKRLKKFRKVKKGKLNISAKNASESELRAANHMKDKGFDVELRDPSNIKGQRTSDLLVDGKEFDVYTPTSANPNRIISAIAKKNSQATGIVLDLSNTSVTLEQLGDIIKRIQGAGATNINTIHIITGN